VNADILTNDRSKKGRLSVRQSEDSNYLERIFFEITDECNLNCEHCYMSSSNKMKATHSIALSYILKVMESASKAGAFRMDFTGGEIFLHKDIEAILLASAEHLFVTNLFTNGTLITDNIVQTIKEVGNIRTIFISLDDIVPESHDKFRGVKGSYSRTLNAFNLLKEAGIKTVANITLHKGNIDRIEEILNYCSDVIQTEARIAPIVYVGRGKCFENNDLSRNQIINAMRIALKNKKELTSGFYDVNTDEKSCIPGCGVGHNMLYIRSNGEICLCPTLSSREAHSFMLGDIKHNEIAGVWRNSPILNDFRNSRCKKNNCKYREVCRGGCRSRAFLINRELNDVDLILCSFFDKY
jgi:radical SAM protein with 4Fe4S-binding SPASM domain